MSKKERVRVAMRNFIGIEVGAVWLSQKGNVFRATVGARTRGRGVGCKVGFGVCVGVVVVLVGGGCGVVGMCVVDGVGVRVAGVLREEATEVSRVGWVCRGPRGVCGDPVRLGQL